MRQEIKRVINGKRYDTNTATILASNEYWDGSNYERGGRNTHLYRSKGGAYFVVYSSQWQGELTKLEALTRAEAIELYEELPEQCVDYEEAFDTVVEEAAGRPALYDKPLKQTAVWLTEEMLEWLKAQSGSMSDQLRAMIEEKMKNE